MAIIEVNYLSSCLNRTVTFNVVLPCDKLKYVEDGYLKAPQKFKTLYLLNGYYGNYTDWLAWTRVEIWAKEHNLCVIMPSGDNSFYLDHKTKSKNNYGKFIGEELVQMTRMMFPLSHKREDTFIAGLSMGGFGAIRNGLKYHKTFGAIGAFSGALNLTKLSGHADDPAILGDKQELENSDANPNFIIEKMLKEKKEFPMIYLSCGLEDGLYEGNVEFRDFLKKKKIKYTWDEEHGGHEWFFWDRQIEKFINWLPLEKADQGRNSGNVKKGK